jgi:hypothetical protein
MPLKEDPAPQRPLDYASPPITPVRLTCFVVVAGVALLAGAVAAWCFFHTVRVLLEVRRVAGSRPIDFDPSYLGMPVEKSVPLGVFSGGVALVAVVHVVRLWNGWKAAPPAA